MIGTPFRAARTESVRVMTREISLKRSVSNHARARRASESMTFSASSVRCSRWHLRASATVAAQTANRLVLEERGVMWVRATTKGRAAHAGVEEGEDPRGAAADDRDVFYLMFHGV